MVTPSAEQRRIIEHPLAPLRVAAGAGTGKTTTIALRLAHLAADEEVAPEQALGITFTNKAAGELAARLREALPEAAAEGREAEVTTYHGFAYSVVREFGARMGRSRAGGLVTTGYVRQMLRDALGFEERRHLDLTVPGSRVDELASLSSSLGDHLLDPADVAGLPGDDPITLARSEMAEALARFSERKGDLGLVDYSDLVVIAHRLITEFPDIRDRIRHRYRIVLLDEYQDTNPGQRELMRAIFGDGFPITAVGDSDQTIYEWRGASLENFDAFPDHFPVAGGAPADTLSLTVSRRSARRIIGLADSVADRIARRGPLRGLGVRRGAPDGEVTAAWFHSAVEEAEWLARDLRRRRDAGTPWSEMALLFRKHRQITLVRDALERDGIPVEVVSLGGLLEVPVVADLHAWLSILGRPDDSPALARVLIKGRHRLGMGDMAAVYTAARLGRRNGEGAAAGSAMLETIDSGEAIGGLTADAAARLEEFRAIYRELLEVAQASNLVELSRAILDGTGTWAEIDALPEESALSSRLNLYRFLDLAEDWSPLEGAPSLSSFLEHLDLLSEEWSGEELDTARVSGEEAVPLLTVHRAKGLEWDVVYLPALADGTFPSAPRRIADHTQRPEILPPHLRLDTAPEGNSRDAAVAAHTDGEWRTAYVAATRARNAIVGTGAYWYTTGKPKDPSDLFELIATASGSQVERCPEPGNPPESMRIAPPPPAPDPHFEDGPMGALRSALEQPDTVRLLVADLGLGAEYDAAVEQMSLTLEGIRSPEATPAPPSVFKTSVSGLVTFATCPQRFHWSFVDRLPRRPSPHLRHGVEVHRRIEVHNRGALPLHAVDEESRAEGDGRPGAFRTFLRSRFADTIPLLVEAPLDLKIGQARVAGRIDAVYEWDPGHWEVVDFKSGRPSADPARVVQLQAYAIAVADGGFGSRATDRTTVTFAYLGGDLAEESHDVDADWLSTARTAVASLTESASSGEKAPAPGDACRHCDFTRFCGAGTAWLEDDQ